MATITFDGKTYKTEDLNDVARRSYNAIRFSDNKLQDLNLQHEIFKTAAVAYSQQIAAQLPDPAHANKKNGVIVVNGKKYAWDSFSEEAKQQIKMLNQVDHRIDEMKLEIALVDAARDSYMQTLRRQLQTHV